MELPSFRRADPARWWRALAVACLVPVLLVTLVPTMLGWQRLVLTDGAQDVGLHGGSLLITHADVVRELHPGDLVVDPATNGIVTVHRVAEVRGADLVVEGDGGRRVLGDSGGAVQHVLLAVPWVGRLAVLGRPLSLLMVGFGALALAVLVPHGRRPAEVRPPPGSRRGVTAGRADAR